MDQAKALAEKATGIPSRQILISATHCHSAPSVFGALGSDCDEAYARFLPGKIAEAIIGAHKNLAPARIGWAVGRDPKNVFCRRFIMKPGTAATNPFSGTSNDQAMMNPGYQNPNALRRTGPVDDQVSILALQTPAGKPLALLGNYSTHYAGAPDLSADYFGVFCRRIAALIGAEKTDPPFVALMSNGTSGDANCCDFVNPPRTFNHFTVGEDVARAAFDAYRTIHFHQWVPLAMAEKLLTLAVRQPSAGEVARAREFLAGINRKPQTVPEVYARETIMLSQLPNQRELKLQAIRIGELGIVALPNEVFGSTGLKIKQCSPLRPTFTIELANGYFGYLPPPEQFPLGGYTTWRARSSCLEEQAEPKITACVLGLLNQVVAARPEKGKAWKPLMDGKTLSGWHPVGDGRWTVEDGAFVGRAHNEKLYGLLFSDATFRDFTVRLKFKCLTGDSGFYIRTVFKKPDQAHGFQVQVGPPNTGTGKIYESYGRGWLDKPNAEEEKKFLKPNDWNDMVIAAHGPHIVVWVNGLKTCELKDPKGRTEGHFALQMHAGCEMEVRFKDIAIAK
jgi:hypothetical protein